MDWLCCSSSGFMDEYKMNTFKEDLSVGRLVEDKFVEILRKKHPSASVVHAFKGYDIWIPEIKKSVEVKFDAKSNYTGNMVVEVEMFGKISGLLSTTADYWVFYDKNVFCLMTPMKIFECIILNKLVHTEFVGKGDTASKKAFLIPKDMLFSYGKIIECESFLTSKQT